MKYCRNCRRKNDKSTKMSINYPTKAFGYSTHHTFSCGFEEWKVEEDTDVTFRIRPIRNLNNNCVGYDRIWYKFWVREGKEGV